MSDQLIRAKAAEMATDKPIDFWIQLGGCWNLFGHSAEIIFPFDEESKAVAWIRKINPFGPNYNRHSNQWKDYYSQRWQYVVPLDASTSRYYTALKVPGLVGSFSKMNFTHPIQTAFEALANGIKIKAEQN